MAGKTTPYSDLEVAPKYLSQPGLEYDPYRTDQTAYKETLSTLAVPVTPQRRICGLSPKAFWIATVVVIIVIAGAVGGGVGGSLASKSKSNDAEPITTTSSTSSAQLQSATTSKASTTTPPPISTTRIVGPTYTLQRDCPSANNSLYGVTLGGTEMQFRKVCESSFLNTVLSGVGNVVNKKVGSLNSCINLCATYNVENATAIADGTNSVCNAVCWRNSLDNDDFPGQCFGFTTQNSSNALVIKEETKCDSAAWINQKLI